MRSKQVVRLLKVDVDHVAGSVVQAESDPDVWKRVHVNVELGVADAVDQLIGAVHHLCYHTEVIDE